METTDRARRRALEDPPHETRTPGYPPRGEEGGTPRFRGDPGDVDVVLRDGSTVRVRAARPDDRDALERFLSGLSEESRIFRFFTPVSDLSWAARHFAEVD